MWKHYWTTAHRALARNPLYTAINAGGLAVGFACCILLGLYVQNELAFDSHHDDVDRIHRVIETTTTPSGKVQARDSSPFPLAQAIRDEVPGIASVVQLRVERNVKIRSVDQPASDAATLDAYIADSTFAAVFDVPVHAGDVEAVLRAPDQAALTVSSAARLFGRTDIVGETVAVTYYEEGEPQELTVGAVVEDPRVTSGFQYDVLVPLPQLRHSMRSRFFEYLSTAWQGGPTVTFVKRAPGTDPASAEERLASIVERNYPADAGEVVLTLQPVTEMRQATEVASSFLTRSASSLYVMGALALLVLIVACVNFITLTLGQSTGRTHEVGVRKALGAQVRQVRQQFWGEALIVSSLAGGLGIVLARLFTPTFNTLAQANVALDFVAGPGQVLLVFGLTVGIGLVAGAYPAMALARLNPMRILRGQSVISPGRGATKVLMVVQFALSIGFLAGALIIARQTDYMQTKDPGFVTERVITFTASNYAPEQPGASEDAVMTLGKGSIYSTFQKEARQLSGVEGVTASLMPVGTLEGNGIGITVQRPEGAFAATVNVIDTTFVEVMGIDVVQGRSLRTAKSEDAVLVNRTFVEAMGWADPIGQEPKAEGHLSNLLEGKRVVGVVEDFHHKSMHHTIEPLVLLPEKTLAGASMNVAVRLGSGSLTDQLQQVEALWEKVAPGMPFDYGFLDDKIAAQYETEQRWQRITTWASVFALLIACAGLFGLATLATQRRTREIGIRKALGASVSRILALVSGDFLKLVGVAFLIAAPLAYGALQEWLQTFPYRIDGVTGWLVVAGMITALVAACAVGAQAYRAAKSNPVDALRSES